MMLLKNHKSKFVSTKIIVSSLLFLDVLFLSTLSPALAQVQTKQEPRECRAVLQSAKRTIERGRKIQVVEISKEDISGEYSDYPPNRTMEYIFSMRGPAVGSVLNSEKFLTSLTRNITRNCQSVGMITFGLANTSYLATLFLMSDNTIQFFECIDPEKKPRWGQRGCI